METVTLGAKDPKKGEEQRHMFGAIDSGGEVETSGLQLRGHRFWTQVDLSLTLSSTTFKLCP